MKNERILIDDSSTIKVWREGNRLYVRCQAGWGYPKSLQESLRRGDKFEDLDYSEIKMIYVTCCKYLTLTEGLCGPEFKYRITRSSII